MEDDIYQEQLPENVKTEDLPMTTNTSLHIGELANPEKLISESQRKEFIKKQKTIDESKMDAFDIPNIEEKPEEIKEKNELSPEDEKLQKMTCLRKLAELQESGIRLSQVYNINSNLDSMKYEYDLHKSILDKKNGVTLMINAFVLVLNVIEYSNERYNPFKLHLKGWAENVNSDLTNYYNIFEEIYEKYTKKGGNMAPELKLLIALSFSAFTFHLSHSLIDALPNLGAFGKDNPELIEKLRQKAITDTEQFKKRMSDQHESANAKVSDLDALRDREIKQLEIEKNLKKIQQTQLTPPTLPEKIYKQPVSSNALPQTISTITKNVPVIINRMKKEKDTESENSEETTTTRSTVSFNRNLPDIMNEVKKHKKEMKENSSDEKSSSEVPKKVKKENSSVGVSNEEMNSISISIGNAKKKKNISLKKK